MANIDLVDLAPRRAAAQSLGVFASLVLNGTGCAFDVSPEAVSPARERNLATAYWMPPARKTGQVVGQAQRADAGAPSSTPVESSDAAARDASAPDTVVPDPATAEAGSVARPQESSGAAGSAGAAGSGNAGGGAPALEPDAGTLCVAGTYVGTFEGSVTFLQGSLSGINGTIRAELVLDPSGDYLRIRQGSVTGVNDQGVKMNAGWTGALSCETGELEGAELHDGTWDNGSRFSGTLAGTYSTSTSSLSGTWQVRSDEFVWAGGNGTWSMRRSTAP